MMQTEIKRQYIKVEGRTFICEDLPELRELSLSEPDEALREVYAFLAEWFSDVPTVEVQTSGSTGIPKRMSVRKDRMMHSACLTCHFLQLGQGDRALLCMDMRYIGAKMMVVRALVSGMELLVRRASGHPLADVDGRIDFLSMVPMQLYYTIYNNKERARAKDIRCIIVGGGEVDETLCRELQDMPCRVYSTYGMTETLSHIALRPLNGPDASSSYKVLGGIGLSLSEKGTLVVNAPMLCENPLQTNDIVELKEDGSFWVKGRADNVVNSGGVKIQIEEDERRLKTLFPYPFALTSVKDGCLGEALVLLLNMEETRTDDELRMSMKSVLPCYHVPKYIFRVLEIPLVPNGKIDRKACISLANAAFDVAHRDEQHISS